MITSPENLNNQNATEELRNAIMKGNTKKVQSILQKKRVNINAKIRYTSNKNIAEYIAIIWAAEKGYREILIMLLKQPGINVNIKDCQGFTALMCAAEQGHRDIVELLLKLPNINVNIQNNKGATALMQAVKNRHKEVVIQLLNHPDIDINIQTWNSGTTALMIAKFLRYEEIIELLLHSERSKFHVKKKNLVKGKETNKNNSVKTENSQPDEKYEKLNKPEWISKINEMRNKGEDFNSPQNSDGCTILMIATQYADFKIMQMILDEKDNNGKRIIDINVKNKYEDTALTIAALLGNEKKMRLLLEYDTDMENATEKDSKKPIKGQNSLSTNNFKNSILKEWMLKIDRMKRRKEDFNAPLSYSNGRTLLMCACATQYANCDILKLILNEKDAQGNKLTNVNTLDKDGNTALTIAVQTDNKKKMMLLLKYGADIELAKKNASIEVSEILEEFHQRVQSANNNFVAATVTGDYHKVNALLKDSFININARLSPFGDTILMHAADEGHKKSVELLLKHPEINVDIRDGRGITALMCAAAKGYDKIVKMLLDHGANVNNQDVQNFSALMCTTEKGHDKIVKMLLEHGAHVDVQGSQDQTPLMLAVYYGYMKNGHVKDKYMKIIKYLLKHGANMNIQNINGDTALILAVAQGWKEVVQLFLEHNIDDDNKNALFMIAIAHGHESIVQLLLEHGANVNSKNHFDDTPLIHAVVKGHTKIVDQLLKHGAEVNSKNQFGMTPLLYAIKNGYPEIVKLLLENGAETNTKDLYGVTPLMFAIENEDSRIVKLLLEYQKGDIDFNISNDYGETLQSCMKRIGRKKIVKLIQPKMEHESQQIKIKPSQEEEEEKEKEKEKEKVKPKPKPKRNINDIFWKAVSKGDVDIMDNLLQENDVDSKTLVNKKDKFGNTALIISSQNGHLNVIRSLLESNADLSHKNKNGDTSLLIACENGDLGVVKLLLSFNADPSLKDSKGNNALIRASKAGHFDVVEELIKRKKSMINSKGENGRTPLMFAAENGHIRIVKFLIKNKAKVNVKDKDNKITLDIVNEKINDMKNKNEMTLSHNLKLIKEILEKKKNQPNNIFEDLIIEKDLDDIWNISPTQNFNKNKKFWEKNKPDNFDKIQMLIKEIEKDPFRGSGRPEPLKGDLKGKYSRVIDKGNRLVYEVDGEQVTFLSCKGHYDQEKRKC